MASVLLTHHVTGRPLTPPFPAGLSRVIVGMGCFWGAERRFWELPGVWTTAAGYAGGATPSPTYEEVCTGRTGHAEVVLVVFDPEQIAFDGVLATFWEGHDPTQGMRQGNDVGTQYRSILVCTDDKQLAAASASRDAYGAQLAAVGLGPITTEIIAEAPFYYAEEHHQQYLSRSPQGPWCNILGGHGGNRSA